MALDAGLLVNAASGVVLIAMGLFVGSVKPRRPAHVLLAALHAPKEEAYTDALRIALRDRRIPRGEEARLARVAERLGIGASRAVGLLAEVEAGRPRAPRAREVRP